MSWHRWTHHIELVALIIALAVLGTVHFSHLSRAQQEEIELRAGLEQLHLLEQAHFEAQGRYFDPGDPQEGLNWKWLRRYQWEFRPSGQGYWLVVHADLDGDGRMGTWGVDHRSPVPRPVLED